MSPISKIGVASPLKAIINHPNFTNGCYKPSLSFWLSDIALLTKHEHIHIKLADPHRTINWYKTSTYFNYWQLLWQFFEPRLVRLTRSKLATNAHRSCASRVKGTDLKHCGQRIGASSMDGIPNNYNTIMCICIHTIFTWNNDILSLYLIYIYKHIYTLFNI